MPDARRPRFTFAVVGRDEAGTLAGVLEQAQRAAFPGDRVWFVDSCSEDDSASVARSLGVEVVAAPAGKGRAIASALARCESGHVCFVDADLFQWTVNIPAALRAATVVSGADMVVGCFSDDRRRVVQPCIYWPLVDALFPDHGRRCDPTPLSGLRVIDAALVGGPEAIARLPAGYGVETHLNLSFACAGRAVMTADLGYLRGPLRGYANIPEMADAVAAAILDFAVAIGRLDAGMRLSWDRWVADVVGMIARQPGPGAEDADFLDARRRARRAAASTGASLGPELAVELAERRHEALGGEPLQVAAAGVCAKRAAERRALEQLPQRS